MGLKLRLLDLILNASLLSVFRRVSLLSDDMDFVITRHEQVYLRICIFAVLFRLLLIIFAVVEVMNNFAHQGV